MDVPDRIRTIAAAAVGATPEAIASLAVAPLGHRVENMTTARLDRIVATTADGTTWSLVAKGLHPASCAPAFAEIPEAFHEQVLADLHWLDEPDVYRSSLASSLPAPLRMPLVHEIESSGDEALTIWMEDVADVVPWTIDRYARTAEALGALAGRWDGDGASSLGLRSRSIAHLFFGKVCHHDLQIQAEDAFWADDEIAAVADPSHRADLLRLADAMPAMLGRLEEQPGGVCHGDATPDNFREPGDGSIVALDWSYGHAGTVGSDLAQLLVGRFESGAADVDEVGPISGAILDGFLAGLDRVGRHVDPDAVRLAWTVHLSIRSVFSALVIDHRPDLDADGRAELLRRRAAVARHGIDLGLGLAG